MKKNIFFLLIVLFVIHTLAGCSKDITLKLQKSTYSAEVGSVTKLKLSIQPSNYEKNINIVWTSSDSKIATVDRYGSVKAVSPGSVIITAKVKDQNNSITAHIKVNPRYKINKENLKIEQGSSEKLEVIMNPSNLSENTVINWSSNNPKIVTVDQAGFVKGVSEGTAIITAKVSNGDKELITHVTVIPKKVTGVKLNKIKTILTLGTSEILQAAVLPIDAKNKNLSWVSNKTNIVKVDKDGKIQALSEGEATITVTTEDGGFTQVCTVKVNKKPTKQAETNPPKTTEKQVENTTNNTTTKNTELRVEVKKGMISFYPNNHDRVSFQSLAMHSTQPNQLLIRILPVHAVDGHLAPPQPYENYDFKAIFHLTGNDVVALGKTNDTFYSVVPFGGKSGEEITVDIYITYNGKSYKFSDTLYQ
jgi:uncharacterized protein YjdB